MEFNGMEFNGMEFNGMEFNGMQYNGMQYNGMEFNAMRYTTIQRNTPQCNATQCNSTQFHAILHTMLNALRFHIAMYSETIQRKSMRLPRLRIFLLEFFSSPFPFPFPFSLFLRLAFPAFDFQLPELSAGDGGGGAECPAGGHRWRCDRRKALCFDARHARAGCKVLPESG